MRELVVLTVEHSRFDTRIWQKEISSLNKAGFIKRYEVADGSGDDCINGIEIHDLGGLAGRGFLARIKWIYGAYKNSIIQKGEVLHFHDPVFLPAALWFKVKGVKVIYDVHEDHPQQVLSFKLPFYVRHSLSLIYRVMEWLAGKVFDGIVAATPAIAEQFPVKKTVLVQNYPKISEFSQIRSDEIAEDFNYVTYIGGISEVRGIIEIVRSLEFIDKTYQVKLLLGGVFLPLGLEKKVAEEPGWENVEYLGWLERSKMAEVLGKSRTGLVLFHPIANHLDAQPNKLFEYMSAGLPVIASNFPLWREIVEENQCGICVNPLKPYDIAGAIEYVLKNPVEAKKMGVRGRLAIKTKFNWHMEEEKLLDFYRGIMAKNK